MSAVDMVTHLPTLPARPADCNKGTFGRVLVVAGSRGMSGAAVLTASAALRGGAGLVRLAVPEGILTTVAAANPCYLTAPLPEDDQGQLAGSSESSLLRLAEANDVVAVGPGLGQSETIRHLLATLVPRVPAPLVLDADGLNGLQHQLEVLKKRTAPAILSPHPGEFARLLQTDAATVQANRAELAVRFAADHRVVLVLKGYGTLVTDGRRLYRNTTGNPGMATGGTGDVLTGLIAALLGQGLDPFAAAQLGVHVHGLAGDFARADFGEVAMIASDLLTYLPRALR